MDRFIFNIPHRITRNFLIKLSDEELGRLEAELMKCDDYQSLSHARTMSKRWEKAYDEILRRKSLRGL